MTTRSALAEKSHLRSQAHSRLNAMNTPNSNDMSPNTTCAQATTSVPQYFSTSTPSLPRASFFISPSLSQLRCDDFPNVTKLSLTASRFVTSPFSKVIMQLWNCRGARTVVTWTTVATIRRKARPSVRIVPWLASGRGREIRGPQDSR